MKSTETFLFLTGITQKITEKINSPDLLRKGKMNRNKYFHLIIIILIFFVVKLTILFLGINELIYNEECFRAFIAKQLLDGPIVPFFDLQIDSYSGGSLVVGLLMVPFFKILGQNLISLKLVALLFSLFSLISLYLFCNKFFNKKVAVVTSLLFIFSPPLFTKYSLITMGFHTESILFSIILIFVFFEINFNNKKNNFYFILLGFIGGFGVWFTYIFSITLFTCLLFWFLFDRRFFLRKNFLIFLISFTIGFSPWIYYNLSHSSSGISIGRKAMFPSFSTDHLIFSLAKLKNLLLNDIRNSFLFEDFIPLGGNYLSTFYYLIFVVSFLVLFWLNRWPIYQLIGRFIPLKRFEISDVSIFKETFLLIYVVIFSLIYSLSNFKVNPNGGFFGYRYLVPLYPFIFILIALFLSKMQERGTKGKVFVSYFLLITLISIGLTSNLKFISFNKIGISFFDIDHTHAYTSLGRKIGRIYAGDMGSCIYLINQVEEKYRFHLYQGLGSTIGLRLKDDFDKCIGLMNRVEERYRPYVYKGFSTGFNWNSYKGDIDKCISLINQVEERYRFLLYQGLGFSIGLRCKKDFDKCISLINRVEERYRHDIYNSISLILKLNRFKGGIEKWISLINQVEEQYRPYFYRGLGRYLTKGRYSTDKYISLINQVEERYRPYFYRSLGTHFIKIYSADKCISLINQIEERYRPDVYEGFGEGIVEAGHWKWIKGIVAYRISLIYWMEEGYKIPFYKGLGKGFAWQHDLGTDRYKVIIEREIEDKYRSYFYKGLNDFGQLTTYN